MEIDDFLRTLAREGELFLAAAELAGADATVPTCPGWRVRDLVLHQGNVHHWATGFVAGGLTEFVPEPTERVADADLPGWFHAGHAALLRALRRAPADLACWSFLAGSPSPRHFWARRQTHETTVHRIDAELAAGGKVSPVAPDVAVDGIDELLTGFHARPRSRVRSARPRTLGIRVAGEPGARWRVVISDEPPRTARDAWQQPVECEISGTAEALYRTLWNRAPDDEAVTVTGDRAVARLWRELSTI